MTAGAFLLLALTGVVAAGNWLAVARGWRGLEYLAKPLTMALLIGVALSLDAHDDGVRAWFVVALVLCLVGDVLLMLPQDVFAPGLAAFLLGHVAYIVGLQVEGVDVPLFGVGVVLVVLALSVIGVRILSSVRAGGEPELAGPVVAYMLVISAMVASAIGTGRALAIAGAVSFYVSDALIAWSRFVATSRQPRVAVMVTYHLGQVGLVLSLV